MAREMYMSEADITSGLPSSHGYTTQQLTTIRELASEWTDTKFDRLYWTPFPDKADTPTTPAAVHEISLLYAQWYARMKLAPARRNASDSDLTAMRMLIAEQVADYMGQDAKSKLGPVAIAGEAITTWGLTNYPDWWLLGCGNKDVDPESVTLTDALGTTIYTASYFRVGYSVEHRSSYISRYSSAIANGALVSYSYSLIRRREQDIPRPGWGRIGLT